MERISEINKQIRSINHIPLNKWRYGETRESLEKQLKESEKAVKEYKAQTEEFRQRLVSANTEQEDISIQMYNTRFIGYMTMLEKHLELKTKLDAIDKTLVGLTTEKIALLEELCGLTTTLQPPPMPVQPVQQQTSPITFPAPELYSGIGLRYSSGC